MGKILPLFLLIPFVEIVLLILVGNKIGFLWTVALVVLTAIIGGSLARYQGAMAWQKLNDSLGLGEMPGNEIVEGILVFLGGILLLTPGFISDTVGFLLLLPWTRVFAREWLKIWLKKKLISGQGVKVFRW